MLSPELTRRFAYHPPTPERVRQHEAIRAAFLRAAEEIDEPVPDGHEKALALTHLQDAMMWSHAAVACQ
jgi:hypothetical protein